MSSRSTVDRHTRADRIEQSGLIMPVPCERCLSHGSPCVVSFDSKKCAGCVRAGRVCRLPGSIAVSLNRVAEAEGKLSVEEEQTFLLQQQALSELDSAQAEAAKVQQGAEKARKAVAEHSAHLVRLRRQKQLLRQKGTELMRIGEAMDTEISESDPETSTVSPPAAGPAASSGSPLFDFDQYLTPSHEFVFSPQPGPSA